ncbi:MAG: DUF5696 domain-containing protein [Saccharofermentanales bacterium]
MKSFRFKVIVYVSVAAILGATLCWVLLRNPEAITDMSKYRSVEIGTVKPGEAAAELNLQYSGYEVVAENSRYRMELDATEVIFRITDKSTGKIWLNGFPADQYGDTVIPKTKRQLKSICSISYSNATAGADGAVSNAADDVITAYTALEDGIEISFTFPAYEIKASVQIYLDATGFRARIPREKIEENGEYYILKIDLMESFGSVIQGSDGYILYPDGSGTLYDCSSSGSGNSFTQTDSVYCNPLNDIDKEKERKSSGYKSILMPYFGSSAGDRGFISYIEEGSDSANISFNPSGAFIKINRVYPSITYRKIMSRLGPDKREIFVTEKDSKVGDLCVKYILLTDNDADYSGMANHLRDYLMQTGRLPALTSAKKLEQIPLALEILTGVQTDTLFGKKGLSMTTYAQTGEILDLLQENGVDSVYSILLGWQKEGYMQYPSSSTPASYLGSAKELKDLLVHNTDAANKMFLLTNYINSMQGSDLFNKQDDAIISFVKLPITNKAENEFYMNIDRQFNKFSSKDMAKYKKLGATGLAFDGIGEIIVSDYTKNHIITRKDSMLIEASMAKLSKESGFFTAVQIGNDYMLPYADYVYNLYDSDSNLFVFSREIPFYQLVVHGLIPYSCDIPGNMTSDFQLQKLKWVEYGSMPYFLVSDKSANDLRDTEIEDIFSPRFSDWKDAIIETYKEFNQRLLPIFNQTVVEHTYINPQLVEMVYQSGHKVYINYSSDKMSVGSNEVPAMDYLVVEP